MRNFVSKTVKIVILTSFGTRRNDENFKIKKMSENVSSLHIWRLGGEICTKNDPNMV